MKKIKITLESQFPDIGIKTQIAPVFKFILGIVNI